MYGQRDVWHLLYTADFKQWMTAKVLLYEKLVESYKVTLMMSHGAAGPSARHAATVSDAAGRGVLRRAGW